MLDDHLGIQEFWKANSDEKDSQRHGKNGHDKLSSIALESQAGHQARLIQNAQVAPILKVTEKVVQQGMVDRIFQLIRLEILLSNVGRMLCFIDQDMIPGLIFGRPALGHRLIPFFCALECGIYIHDDPAIIKEPVMNQLTDVELTSNQAHTINRPWKK